MIVMKFGGTSVGSADAFAHVAAIVADKISEQAQTPRPGVAVVTSALSISARPTDRPYMRIAKRRFSDAVRSS